MKTLIGDSYFANIHMAGDISHCGQVISKYVRKGACVHVIPLEYIYTGGRENGFMIGLISYPKFPKSNEEILIEATEIAELCRNGVPLSTSSFNVIS